MNVATPAVNPPPTDANPRSLKAFLILFAKGFCMGTADVVPGVSGGTMALVLGIYEELLQSIRSFDLGFIRRVTALQIKAALQGVPLPFLIAVFGGILCAIFSLAKVLSWLLANHPVSVWSFFFGLILASALMVGRRIEAWPAKTIAGMLISAGAAYGLVGIVPIATPDSQLFLFFCGMIAICAMVLPGISGSFILVLLGKYQTVLEAVHRLDLMTLIVFAAGAATGLILFVRLLNWLLHRYHNVTLACLTGLMIGSLRKIWPWKASAPNDSGLEVVNVLPTGWSTDFWMACGLALIGILIVAALQWMASRER